MDKPILTTKQVADLFGVVPQTVITWANEGRLPCFRTPGQHRRFRREDVDRLLASGSALTESALRPTA